MKNCLLLLLLFSISLPALDAQQVKVKGKVYDLVEKKPLTAVNIYNQTDNTGTFSESDGSFEITITRRPTTLIFSYLGYDNYRLTIKQSSQEELEIYLQPNALRLPDIEVIAEPVVEKITPVEFSVRDFVILDDQILTIKYGGISKGNFLELLDLNGNILHTIKVKVKGVVDRLHRSCLGNIHLIGNREVVEVQIRDQSINLINKYAINSFEKYILPCVAASEDFIYTKEEMRLGQQVKFDFISKKEGIIKNKIVVSDWKDILRMREEFAMRSYLESYFAAGTANPENPQNQITRPEHFDGWQNLFYKPIYSPLYNTGAEMCLFNHTLGFLRFYTYAGDLKYQFPITYHQDKSWKPTILRDEKRNKFYTIYKDGLGRKFYEINLANGATKPAFRIETAFIEKMMIYDGFLYYLDSGLFGKEVSRRVHKVKVD